MRKKIVAYMILSIVLALVAYMILASITSFGATLSQWLEKIQRCETIFDYDHLP